MALAFLWLAVPGIAGQGAETAIEITSDGASCTNGDCTSTVQVEVTAEKRRCAGDRKVRFYALYVDDKVKFDTDRTHDDGLAMGYGKVPAGVEGYLIKVAGSQAGETKCKPAKLAEQ